MTAIPAASPACRALPARLPDESGLTDDLFQTEQQSDGALFAWKARVIHA